MYVLATVTITSGFLFLTLSEQHFSFLKVLLFPPKRIRLAVADWQLFFPVKLWSNHFSIGAIVIVPPLSLSFSSSHQIKDKVIDYWLVLGRQHSKKGEGRGKLIKYYFNHQQKGNKRADLSKGFPDEPMIIFLLYTL